MKCTKSTNTGPQKVYFLQTNAQFVRIWSMVTFSLQNDIGYSAFIAIGQKGDPQKLGRTVLVNLKSSEVGKRPRRGFSTYLVPL